MSSIFLGFYMKDQHKIVHNSEVNRIHASFFHKYGFKSFGMDLYLSPLIMNKHDGNILTE